MSKPSKQELHEMITDFNTKFLVGTEVHLRTDTEIVDTTVQTKAGIIFGEPMAFFIGIDSPQLISNNRVFK